MRRNLAPRVAAVIAVPPQPPDAAVQFDVVPDEAAALFDAAAPDAEVAALACCCCICFYVTYCRRVESRAGGEVAVFALSWRPPPFGPWWPYSPQLLLLMHLIVAPCSVRDTFSPSVR